MCPVAFSILFGCVGGFLVSPSAVATSKPYCANPPHSLNILLPSPGPYSQVQMPLLGVTMVFHGTPILVCENINLPPAVAPHHLYTVYISQLL
jgi:hypothetical protein